MRIVSGKCKGIRITAPKKLPVRPTTDMAKEALFNILDNNYYFDDIAVLDLFAGIGSICLEFASRGTTDIVAVDKYRGCTQFISATAEKLELPLTIINKDVYKFLKTQTKQYDVIFADPPYNFSAEDFEQISMLVFEKHILSQRGMLIIEHSNKTDLTKMPHFVKDRKYGGNVFSFFELEP